MKFIFVVFVILGCTHQPVVPTETMTKPQTPAASQDVEAYKTWLKKKTFGLPQEQKLISNYLTFLQLKKSPSAQKVIQQLVTTARRNQSPVLYQNFGLFKNSSQLIYKAQSLATLSMKHLVPLLDNGDKKAIELLLVYSAASSVDSTEAELLSPLLKMIHEKHPETVSLVMQNHQTFFQRSPPMMIQ